MMEEKVSIIGIFVRDTSAAEQVNSLLHEFSHCILGRMGIPWREQELNIISVIVHGTANEISTLSGKLGRISQITVKAMQTSL